MTEEKDVLHRGKNIKTLNFQVLGKKKQNKTKQQYGEIIENSHQSSVKEPMSQKLQCLKDESVHEELVVDRMRVATERQVTWIQSQCVGEKGWRMVWKWNYIMKRTPSSGLSP